MERNITAWFSIGSTYTFLTAMRIKTLLQTHQIEIKIIPISVKRIMGELGNAPFTPDMGGTGNTSDFGKAIAQAI